MADELKPCPFCGGEADEHRDPGPTGELYVWVGCNNCDATSACVDERSMQPEESDAVTLWNTRQPEVAGEPVAWVWYHNKFGFRFEPTDLTAAYSEYPGWTSAPIPAHPDPRVAELERENAALRAAGGAMASFIEGRLNAGDYPMGGEPNYLSKWKDATK